MITNRQIDALLLSAEWLIEPVWGLQQLNAYLAQLDLLEKGATYADLGFSTIREAVRPVIVNMAGARSDGKSEVANSLISHLSLSGVMRMEDGSYTFGAKTLSSFLRNADAMPEVAGHLIEINSGGGEALAGALMHETVKNLTKPVYALVHLAASAAYLTASAATKVFMQSEFSSLGSIGAMASLDKEMLKLYRENVLDVYASNSQEKNEEFRQLIVDGKTDLYEKRLTALASVFHQKVKASRPKVSLDTLKGRLYIGDTAMAMELADGYSDVTKITSMLLGSSASSPALAARNEDDSFDEDDFNNLNTNDMTLQQRFSNQLLRVLGINVPGTDEGMAQAVTALEGMASLEESVNAAVATATAPMEERLADMTTRLEAALKTKPAVVDNTALLERMTALETQLAASQEAQANLSKRVLESANSEGSGDGGDNNHYLTVTEKAFGERVRVNA